MSGEADYTLSTKTTRLLPEKALQIVRIVSVLRPISFPLIDSGTGAGGGGGEEHLLSKIVCRGPEALCV